MCLRHIFFYFSVGWSICIFQYLFLIQLLLCMNFILCCLWFLGRTIVVEGAWVIKSFEKSISWSQLIFLCNLWNHFILLFFRLATQDIYILLVIFLLLGLEICIWDILLWHFLLWIIRHYFQKFLLTWRQFWNLILKIWLLGIFLGLEGIKLPILCLFCTFLRPWLFLRFLHFWCFYHRIGISFIHTWIINIIGCVQIHYGARPLILSPCTLKRKWLCHVKLWSWSLFADCTLSRARSILNIFN